MNPPSPIIFDGQVRLINTHHPITKFKDGRWIFEFEEKHHRWVLIVEGKKDGDRPFKVPLQNATNIPCQPPTGTQLTLHFKGKQVEIKTESSDVLKKVFSTLLKIMKSNNEEYKLSNAPMINRRNTGAQRQVNGLSSSSSSGSSCAGSEAAKKKFSIEAAHELIIQNPSPDKVTFTAGAVEESQNRLPTTNHRLRSQVNQQSTPKKTPPLKENQSVLQLLDKENVIKTPCRTASSPNLNRTPLSDKHGVSASRFYGRGSIDYASTIPGMSNMPSSLENYSTRISSRNLAKRSKPALDVYSGDVCKRLKRLNNENDACWKSSATSPPSKQPLIGFSNLGNTCYMNSILQSLFALDIFSRELWKTYTHLKDFVTDDSLLSSLPQLLKNKDSSSRSTKDDLLLRVKSAISASATRFSGYSQHDAHEFLAQVLDQLKEEIKKLCDDNDKVLTNPVENNFEFAVSHCIECQKCFNTVTKEERFNDLSLDLPFSPDDEDIPSSLQKLIDTFFNSEEVTYKCEKCCCELSLIKHNFIKLPRILILHVKRYNFDSKISKNVKCTKTICIPKFLSLSQHCSERSRSFADITASTKKLVKFVDNSPARCRLRSPPSSSSKCNGDTFLTPKDHVLFSPIRTPGGSRSLSCADFTPTGTKGDILSTANVREQLSPALLHPSASRPTSQTSSKVRRRLYPTPSVSLNRFSPRKMYNFRSLSKSANYEENPAQSTNPNDSVPSQNSTTDDDDADYKRVLERSIIEQKHVDEEFQQQIDQAMKESMLNKSIDESLNKIDQVLERLEAEAEDIELRVENGEPLGAFRLCGIVTHLGLFSSAGHYVCDVFDLKNNKWRSCDDSRVSDTKEKDVQAMRRRDGYIFFYVAKQILDDLDDTGRSDNNGDEAV